MRHMTREEFEASIIGQDDDEDYDESGYVAGVLPEGVAYIGRYSHCSCYGTFESLCGGGVSDSYTEGTPTFDWSGDPDEMVRMANRKADPAMPIRSANPADHDYDHLCKVYEQILEWNQKRRHGLCSHPDNQPSA